MDIKILIVVFVGILIIILMRCGGKFTFGGVTFAFPNCDGDYFTKLSFWYDYDNSISYYIVYANDTKVKYLISNGSITPLYNADGTLQVYDERSSSL